MYGFQIFHHYDIDTYNTFMGNGPERIVQIEHWSNPDAETYLTGIDYYDHPRRCRLKMKELYPSLYLPIFETDDPRPRPAIAGSKTDPEKHVARWGDGETWTFAHGETYFKTPEEVFSFSPLEHAADFKNWIHIVEHSDYSSEEILYEQYKQFYPDDAAPGDLPACAPFYNTMIMWPLLTFGWELFLECCLDDRFERVMDEFAELNRRAFKAIDRLPVNFVICHDDIMTTRGPICSPAWMNKYIFPRYEEFFGIVKQSGKRVIFIADGDMNAYADDVIACGASGIISESYTDYKAIAKRHKDCVLAGEGDNRILQRNDPDEIRKMVESMVLTGKMSGGYMMCIGNHIPWNVNPEGVKRYLDLVDKLAFR